MSSFPFINAIAIEIIKMKVPKEELPLFLEDIKNQIQTEINHIKYITFNKQRIIISNSYIKWTKRERQVLEYLIRGVRTNEIAADMKLVGNTITTVKKRILEKMRYASMIDIAHLVNFHGIDTIPTIELEGLKKQI